MDERKPKMVLDRDERLKSRSLKALSKLKKAAPDEWAAKELARDNGWTSLKAARLKAHAEVENARAVHRWAAEKASAAYKERPRSESKIDAAAEKASAAREAQAAAEKQAMVTIMNAYCTEPDLLKVVKTVAALMAAAPDEYVELHLADLAYDDSVAMMPITEHYEQVAFENALAYVAPEAYAAYYKALLQKAKTGDATTQTPDIIRV